MAEDLVVPVAILPEVLVHGAKIGAARTFSRDDVQRSGASSAAEFVERVAGLALRQDGTAGGKSFARIGGSNANQVLVLVDGVRIADIASGETDLSRIPAEWIESIEVSQGGGAVGAEAIGGVISISTSRAQQNALNISADGNGTISSLKARQSYVLDKMDFSVGADHEQGRGNYRYRITTEDGNGAFTDGLGEIRRRENNELTRDRVIGNVHQVIGEHEFNGSLWLERSAFGIPGYLAPRATELAEQNEDFLLAQFGWQARSSLGNVHASIAQQNQRRDYSDPDPLSYLHESHERSERFTAVSGLSHERLSTRFSLFGRAERERLNSGVIESEAAVRDRWLCSAQFGRTIHMSKNGVHKFDVAVTFQAERFGDAPVQFLPSAEASWVGEAGLPISAGLKAGRNYLAPSFYNLFWNDELVAQGNPDLRPESAVLMLGYVRAHTRNSRSTSLEVSASSNQVKDLIYWRQSFDGRWTPQNLKTASLELLVVYARQEILKGRLYCGGSFEWLEARDRSGERTTDGKYLIYRPAHTARASLEVNVLNAELRSDVRWVDRQAVLETNSKWLAEYTLVAAEIRRGWQIGKVQCEATVRCENILNEDYRVVRHAPMPLREWWIGFSIHQGKKSK